MLHRPAEVITLVAIILWLSLWNSLRFMQSIIFWDTLEGFKMHGSSLFLAISGGVWASLGFYLGWADWKGKPWAWGTTVGAVTGYTIWEGVDRFLIQEPHGNEPFVITSSILIVLYVLILLFSRNVRDFFHYR
jgi:hypothetical protein